MGKAAYSSTPTHLPTLTVASGLGWQRTMSDGTMEIC